MNKNILSVCVGSLFLSIMLAGCSKKPEVNNTGNETGFNPNYQSGQQSTEGAGSAMASGQIPMVSPPNQEQIQQVFQNAPGVPTQTDMQKSEIKSWLIEYLNKYQLELDWRLAGNYSITKFELNNLQNIPPGQVGAVLSQMMTLTNIEKLVLARSQNTQIMPFNHPPGVFAMICAEKKLTFVEMNSPQEFETKISSGGFPGCKLLDLMFGTQNSQQSGSLPPFAHPQNNEKK